MSTSVTIVQHGEKAQHPGDPGLTERGLEQARCAAEVLAASSPAAIFTSPYRRARETAAPLAHMTGLTVIVDERLRERMNLDEGVDPERFAADWSRTTQDRDWTPPGGRSSRRTGQDMLEAINAVARVVHTTVLAGHGGATVDLLRALLGDPELERRASGIITRSVPAGAITRLVLQHGSCVIDTIADTSHLPETLRR